MSTEDTRDNGRTGAPASPDPKNEPQARDPNVITDADRAANPFAAARREREMHRDQGGRFAQKPNEKQSDGKPAKADGKEGDEPDEPTQQDRQQQSGQVPHQALAAERGKRQAAMDENAALRREIAELRGMVMARPQQHAAAPQAPQAPPEFWQDPNAAMDHRLREAMSPMQQALQQQRLGTSQMIAVQVHGADAVQSAIQALGELKATNPAEFQRLEAAAEMSFDPVGDVVRWHKNTTALREIGNDPSAYRERLRQELLAEMQQGGGDPQHAPPATQRQPQTAPLPTSFAAARSGGARGGPAYGGPRSLDTIMGR